MPELPEVETTRRGIAPHLVGRRVVGVAVRNPRLRWPVPPQLASELSGHQVVGVDRRGKYLLLRIGLGTLIAHLGMSGSLRILPARTPAGAHDHVDLVLDDGRALRLTDPRRFGCLLWTRGDPLRHPLLAALGPEPFDAAFSGDYLFRRTRGRRLAVKALLMDGRVVAGVGNIYANESLFFAGIHPGRPAGRIGLARYDKLSAAVRDVLQEAIRAGGTTLRDFVGGDGQPGYFGQQLRVYEREGEPCGGCGDSIRRRVIGQRASYFCPRCQR
jgi:formamidopyrimidine-DNA glycosylase